MTLSVDGFKSSQVFDLIQIAFKDDKVRNQSIKSANAIIVFQLSSGSKTENWYLDLKKSGTVGKGLPSEKADITLIITDENFKNLVEGKANAQRLFMGGKLKVKGNVMKASAVEGVLKAAEKAAKSKL